MTLVIVGFVIVALGAVVDEDMQVRTNEILSPKLFIDLVTSYMALMSPLQMRSFHCHFNWTVLVAILASPHGRGPC